ncbi:MAG: SNF2-related protein [Acidobacteria bacterium]|nr:SNF2-related protein [Acidobacteriota bacterium]
MLKDRDWQFKYPPEDGDLVRVFYVPALQDAARYDRLTGYFDAGALALAARGVESLVRNEGRMRLIVGCTLDREEIDAIREGETLRDRVERRLTELPLAPPDTDAAHALELLAWMIGRGHLNVKVAVPCDAERRPIEGTAIFHEKSAVIEDRAGYRIAWTGSLNETTAGWQRNWESINVYRSWGPEPGRVDREEQNFARLWEDQSPRAIVLDVPDAARQDLLRFLPPELPARLSEKPPSPQPPVEPATPVTPEPPRLPPTDRRRLVWSFIQRAPSLPAGGAEGGAATAAIDPWPHQVRAFERLYERWPPKLLIADEVGLGKTIQAGLLLRQAWLAGRAKRILILAPKAVLKQWQIELREKFNLNWPIYDEGKLVSYPARALRGSHERKVDATHWHEESAVLVSSQLMRRKERAAVLLEEAEPWDLILLDEAHHARRRAAGSPQEGGPNALLKLMRALKERTQGLILLTATPMQVHPIEVWDLLDLLGLPPEWTETAFLDFFKEIRQPSPSAEALDRMALLFQAVERRYGEVSRDAIHDLTELSRLRASALLRALRDEASIPRRRLETAERRAAIRVMLANTPIRRLISRHTRELLRRYAADGVLSTAIADRQVQDRFVALSDAERGIYEAVDEYISTTYKRAAKAERSAVGFVMTIYRRRLASSFAALGATLSTRRQATLESTVALEEDAPDDEALDEVPDIDDLRALESQASAVVEQGEIDGLLEQIAVLPPDSKLAQLNATLDEMMRDGYEQVMVFTQYTDTMDFLRSALRAQGHRLLCFSGRGGETPVGTGDEWRVIDREQVKRRFRDGDADVLLCTDAAAEGLNFQFCGALVNYDMPWNPMRVEQRIGRIDRVGQRHATIRVVNLHYEGTVETAVYGALRDRIGLFEQVVGRLQPILSRMPREIADAVLSGGASPDARNIADRIKRRVSEEELAGFDIDAALDPDLAMPDHAQPPVTLDDLDRVIRDPELMPPGTEVQPLGSREYSLQAPGMAEPIRVTTDAAYYEENAESVELWSPGNPFFTAPDLLLEDDEPRAGETLKDILAR